MIPLGIPVKVNIDSGGKPTGIVSDTTASHLAQTLWSVMSEATAIFGAIYHPPENLWLKVFFTDSDKSQAAAREFLKRYFSRTENRDAPINDKVAPVQIAAVGQWGTHRGEHFACLKSIKQPTLVVSGNHDVIAYTDQNPVRLCALSMAVAYSLYIRPRNCH
jgi:pimeloyl-ACP methyl ester carboxylesterase